MDGQTVELTEDGALYFAEMWGSKIAGNLIRGVRGVVVTYDPDPEETDQDYLVQFDGVKYPLGWVDKGWWMRENEITAVTVSAQESTGVQ